MTPLDDPSVSTSAERRAINLFVTHFFGRTGEVLEDYWDRSQEAEITVDHEEHRKQRGASRSPEVLDLGGEGKGIIEKQNG